VFDGLAYTLLNENQIGNCDRVVRIDISSERSQRSIWHADHNLRHVLK
jgi:hypothetical protein